MKRKLGNKVKCLICKKNFRKLGGGHLEKMHKINVDKYLIKFPKAKTASDAYIDQAKRIQRKQFKDEKRRKKAGERKFDFIRDQHLKVLLRRDYKDAKKCLKNELWKPSIILYGSIIEAVLIEKINQKEKNFEKVINQALEKKVITKQQYYRIQFLRDLRNYVHLHKEIEEKIEIDENWARTFSTICESIINRFKK